MLTRPKQKMPGFVKDALEAEGVMEAYRARPPYQRNDYLGWIFATIQGITAMDENGDAACRLKSVNSGCKLFKSRRVTNVALLNFQCFRSEFPNFIPT